MPVEGRQSGGKEREGDAHKLRRTALNELYRQRSGGFVVDVACRRDIGGSCTAHSVSLV